MHRKQPLRAAAIQMASGTQVDANLLTAERLLEEAARAGVRLAVLPENFACLEPDARDLLARREAPGDGPLQDFLSRTAARLGLWIVGGTLPLEGDDPDRWRAACLLYDDRGRAVARYDKRHLFDVTLPGSGERYRESDAIEPGDRVVVADTPLGRLGLAVCYDLRFPELFRAMVDRGAELFALPAAFTAATGQAHWETLLRARAIENLAWVIAGAQGGFHVGGRETWGHSMVIDPWGTVLAKRPRGDGVAAADIDPDFQRATRQRFPCLEHRRRD